MKQAAPAQGYRPRARTRRNRRTTGALERTPVCVCGDAGMYGVLQPAKCAGFWMTGIGGASRGIRAMAMARTRTRATARATAADKSVRPTRADSLYLQEVPGFVVGEVFGIFAVGG